MPSNVARALSATPITRARSNESSYWNVTLTPITAPPVACPRRDATDRCDLSLVRWPRSSATGATASDRDTQGPIGTFIITAQVSTSVLSVAEAWDEVALLARR